MIEQFSLKNGLPYGAIPFGKIPSTAYLEIIETAIQAARANIEQIKSQRAAPDFKNTIEALEFSSLPLERASGVFFNLLHACSDNDLEAQSDAVSSKLAEYSNDIQLDEVLFDKIKTVHQNQARENLNQEQTMLLKKYYEDFARNGALLSPDKKEKLREIDRELAQLTPRFGQNLLKATGAFLLTLADKKDLDGLPESAVQAAAQAAVEKNLPGQWCFSLQAPSYLPFMTYAKNRALREKLWFAYNQRSLNDAFSNKELCEQIAHLRARRAQLLGYNTHADFVLERRMAKNSKKVRSFLEQLIPPSMATARKEIEDLRRFAAADGVDTIQPWDFAYYSEKLKEQKYDFSDEDLRPYFQLEKVIDGVFLHAQKLFGLKFKESKDIPVYHTDVKVFEVSDAKGFVGLLYFDVFPRDNKRGGAWMTTFLEQGSEDSTPYRPHVSIVCSFTKPTAENPSLLTFGEVQTLFHEFGHALHSLLSSCHYPSVAGTNVLWDFVELPSQIMENWALEKETLLTFARHHETGATLPEDLYTKVKASKNFNAGYASVRQLSFSLVDLAWHDVTPDRVPKTDTVEDGVLDNLRILPKIANTNFSVSFTHIFSGGYSAGYYSYKWAEVLDADAFEYFKEKGVYNQEVAQKFRDNILSRGGTQEPDVLYRNFRGRDPDSQALLRRSGLI